ncbi:MAG: right-handed parallel beta-helix repeat-containing protein [Ignavibacteria bacterium]|jgi:hypothetical protein
MHTVLLLASLMLALGQGVLFAQTSVRIPEPNLHPSAEERHSVYLATDGNDANAGERTSPVRTFARAIALLKERTSDAQGRVPCAFRFLPGEYTLQSNFVQRAEDYKITGLAGTRYLDLSIEGEGLVILNAAKIIVPAGHGVFTLCGRGITLNSIVIRNSSEFGIRLGQPGYRCTNVLLKNVVIDGTYSHGIKIGDETSAEADTTMLVHCTVRNTNLMNIRGEKGQFGSAIKMFGARDVIVDSCFVERNWGEAVCVNNSQRVEVRNTTIIDNWAPAVYCDVASDVRIHSNVFKSNADTTIFPRGRRGMVGVLLSAEPWDGSRTDYFTERIDIYNNTFINMAGCLDIWEGSVGFLQRQIIRNIRFAHNTCIGMWTTQGNTSTAFVNAVYSSPFPVNRSLSNVRVSNNIFSVSPLKVAPRLWVRMPSEVIPAFTYPYNYWRTEVPGIGTTFNNVVNTSLPESEPASLYPSATPSLRGRVPSIADIDHDARGLQRERDSTNAGAYEWERASGVSEGPQTSSRTVMLIVGRQITAIQPVVATYVRVYAVDGSLLTEAYIPAGEVKEFNWDAPSAIVVID